MDAIIEITFPGSVEAGDFLERMGFTYQGTDAHGAYGFYTCGDEYHALVDNACNQRGYCASVYTGRFDA